MPEIVEVETYRRYLEQTALDRKIAAVEVMDVRILDGVTPGRIAAAFQGRTFTSARRRGKRALLKTANGPGLGLHFGMTGWPDCSFESSSPPAHARVVFRFQDGGFFAFVDARMFGGVSLVGDADAFLDELGPDAFKVDLRTFRRLLEDRRGALKGALLNQRLLAGLGNVYTDEICFQAGLDPRVSLRLLAADDHRRLHRAMRRILLTSLRLHTDWTAVPRRWLIPHRIEGGPCPRCRTALTKAVVAGRSTYFCSTCQASS